MGILYYNIKRRRLILSKSENHLPPDIRIIAKGDITVNCLMRSSTYSIDIGELKTAFVATPMVIRDLITFTITPGELVRLPSNVYTPEIAHALGTLRDSHTLHQLIWDYVGINCGETIRLGEVTSVRKLPGLSEGKYALRLCEAYLPFIKGARLNERSFFFITPFNRSLSTVAKYVFTRDSDSRVTVVLPR